MNKYVLALTSLVLALAASLTQANPFEKTLPNGLRVIVKEDHRAPTVVHMVWYRAGSMDEKDGTSGVAHVLEHMMFKGTRNFKSGEFNKRVAEAGGRDNAFTSLDYTAYFQIVPNTALSKMMRLESDRMKNLIITPKEFEAEIKVVMEERRMRTEDNPVSQVHEAMNAVTYQAHPYRRPIIGWMDDLEHMSWQDAADWYRHWYAPNNAYVIVVGDVDHQQVFRLAERHYGALKARPLPVRKPQNEPEQTGVRRVNVKAAAKLPYIALSWKTPKLVDVHKDRDPYALDVLAAILSGHDAARLAKSLVRGSAIAQAAGAGYDPTVRGETTFTLDGTPAAGRTIAELEAALRNEIKQVAESGVTAEELSQVKTQLIAGQIYKRDSLMAQAIEIGGVEATGGHWKDIDVRLEKLKSVTAEEVQAVAGRYFKDDTLTIGVLDPLPPEQVKPKRGRGFAKH
jgi:zinc protease